jgi:hypothetical protein
MTQYEALIVGPADVRRGDRLLLWGQSREVRDLYALPGGRGKLVVLDDGTAHRITTRTRLTAYRTTLPPGHHTNTCPGCLGQGRIRSMHAGTPGTRPCRICRAR